MTDKSSELLVSVIVRHLMFITLRIGADSYYISATQGTVNLFQ